MDHFYTLYLQILLRNISWSLFSFLLIDKLSFTCIDTRNVSDLNFRWLFYVYVCSIFPLFYLRLLKNIYKVSMIIPEITFISCLSSVFLYRVHISLILWKNNIFLQFLSFFSYHFFIFKHLTYGTLFFSVLFCIIKYTSESVKVLIA